MNRKEKPRATRESDKPETQIQELHESLGFSDWEREMKLSQEAATAFASKAPTAKSGKRKKKKP